MSTCVSGFQLLDHLGNPVRPDADFFQAPPDEIGPLISAHSTLKQGTQPLSWVLQVVLTGFFGVLFSFAFWLFANFVNADQPSKRETTTILYPCIGAVLGMFLAWRHVGFGHQCSFVGEAGVACYTMKHGRKGTVEQAVLRFSDALSLLSRVVPQEFVGLFSWNSYDFQWRDGSNKTRFRLEGAFRRANPRSRHWNAYSLAFAADLAWTAYLTDIANETIREQGFFQFNLSDGRWVRVGSGYLQLNLRGGEPVRVDRTMVESFHLKQGVFSVRMVDAAVFGRRGKYSFSLDELENSSLFQLIVSRLTGVRLEGF